MSQRKLVKLLAFDKSVVRISEYESGSREPNLLLLTRYAKLANVEMEWLVDDEVSVEDFELLLSAALVKPD